MPPKRVVSLRPARREDAAEMRQLVREAYTKYVDRIGREPEPMTVDYEQVAVSGGCVLAISAERLLGLMAWDVEDDAVLIENIAVSPSAQGDGVGSRLLGYAEQIACEAGRERLRLYTNAAMTENLDYYPRRGFVETHRAEEHGFARVFFEKEL